MPSTFMGLNTGMTGIHYYQAALNTSAHNISNAAVTGYSRQQVLAQAAPALRVRSAYGMMGTGVQTTGITQLRNVYYDTKYRSANSKSSEYSNIYDQLSQLQSYMNEMKTESGYTTLLGDINSTMQDLSTNPSDPTYRTAFVQSVNNLTDYINEVATNYQNTQQDINNEIAIHVDTINSISSQIYTLNQQIRNIETRGGNANDLRDQRELLVDQLSELVNVTVIETPIMYGSGVDATESGASHYQVRIGNTLLVDDMECNQLKVIARDEKVNQNDIDGLYDIYWEGLNQSTGEKLNFNSANVTGLIKGLLEVRDGNNANPFSGTIAAMETGTEYGSIAKVELSEGMDVDKLNLPNSGIITLNCKEYFYDGWEASYDENGKLTSFTFKNITTQDETGKRVSAELKEGNNLGKEASMGQKIDCKGIPYYMTQLNEFVRTLSNYMNDIFTTGVDSNGDAGVDFFTAADVNGNDYVLTNTEDDEAPTELTSSDSSYYRLTALNWSINQSILADSGKLVVSYKEDIEQGNKSAKGVLDKIIAGMEDQSMYSQGTPAQFLQSITTSLAVDVAKYEAFATNMDDVANVINQQRLSVSSVDTNEEATSLIMYQNGYNLSSKVISIMNEVYDKLINGTGV